MSSVWGTPMNKNWGRPTRNLPRSQIWISWWSGSGHRDVVVGKDVAYNAVWPQRGDVTSVTPFRALCSEGLAVFYVLGFKNELHPLSRRSVATVASIDGCPG